MLRSNSAYRKNLEIYFSFSACSQDILYLVCVTFTFNHTNIGRRVNNSVGSIHTIC